MQHKFNYVKGLAHGAYQFSYQYQEKPVYYKFQYKKGLCHGAYKFTYGEKAKPIYVEESFKHYTYWGRAIDVEQSLKHYAYLGREIDLEKTAKYYNYWSREIDAEQSLKHYNYWGKEIDGEELVKPYTYWDREMDTEETVGPLSFKIPTIYWQKAVNLMNQAVNNIEQNKSFGLDSREPLESFTNQGFLLGEWSKKQLDSLSQTPLLKGEALCMDLSQLEHLLAVLRDLKSEIYKDNLLSPQDSEYHVENQETLKQTGGDIELLKPSNLNPSYTEVDTLSSEMLYTTLLNQVQIDEVMALERVFIKEMECFLGRLNQLIRINSFDLYSHQNASLVERTTDMKLYAEGLKFMGIKQKVDDEIEVTGTEHFTHKYLKIQANRLQGLSKKFKSYRLDVSAFLDSKIEKDILQKIYTALERNIFKDALKQTSNKLLDKKVTREVFIMGLEQYLEKGVFKEISIENLETFLEKIVFKELANQVHTHLLDLLHHKELLKDRVMAQLETSPDYFLSLYINNTHEGLTKDTKYQILINRLSKRLDKHLRLLDEKGAFHLEPTLRDILKQEITPLDPVPQDLIQEDPIQLNKNLLIHLEESERTLKLYKRFWIVSNSDFKDLMILPDHDYPYNSEPIIDDMELMPENHHVVYPNEFYKRIDCHPIPNGKNLAPDEIGVSINILIDLINIFIMMWCKFTPAFWGWTGTQAVIGMVDSIYEFMTLETSRDWQLKEGVKEQYDRAYKWLRWEGEQMALKARHDIGLRGNYYVGLMLEELINYMVDHHFDVLPLFEDVNKMDEWRTMFGRDINKDIKFVLDKVKGIRHKILEKEVRPYES